MWQSPNQKTRGGKRNGRERGRSSLQLKRVTADIRSVTSKPLDGRPEIEGSARILLNDLSPKGVGIYCNRAFISGQEISIVLTLNSQIYLRGKVIYCQEKQSKTAVITSAPFYYRIGIKFIFANAAEEAAVAKYCADILDALDSAA